MSADLLTIGQLAARAGLRTSALRFYEAEGLLQPAAHSAAGYRLYDEQAAATLHTIQRAQRLGFSLADIRTLLEQRRSGDLPSAALTQLATQRYLALEEQIAPLLVLQHELGLLLNEIHTPSGDDGATLDRLIAEICADPLHQPSGGTLDALLTSLGCCLARDAGHTLRDQLRGEHFHIWHERASYTLQFVRDDPALGATLTALAALEAGCTAHPETRTLAVSRATPGWQLIISGPHAALLARLFLALESGG